MIFATKTSRVGVSEVMLKSCSPNRTLKRSVLIQWAAVNTCFELIKEPPHLKEISPNEFLYPTSAIQGQAPSLAGTPPTTLLCVSLENPHPSLGVSKRAWSPMGAWVGGAGASVAGASYGQQIFCCA